MDRKSKLRQIALAAIVAMGAVQGVNAQTLPDNGSSAGVVSQPGTTTALPANTSNPAGLPSGLQASLRGPTARFTFPTTSTAASGA